MVMHHLSTAELFFSPIPGFAVSQWMHALAWASP